MDIIIRKFENTDAERVADIMYASFNAVFGKSEKMVRRPASYWQEISHGNTAGNITISYVAESNGVVAGYLRVSINTSNGLGVLEVIGVDPNTFSRGIGQTLFAEAERFWKEHSIRKAYTCTSHTNLNAQKFYKKLGFEEEGRLKAHFHPDRDEIQLGKFYN